MSGVLPDFMRSGRRSAAIFARPSSARLGNDRGSYAAGTVACVLEAWNRLNRLKKQ